MPTSTFSKPTILLGVILILAGIGAILIFNRSQLPTGTDLIADDQPTMGNPKALVHVVVFEEPKCPACKEFNHLTFPLLKKEFVDTNKIRYTVIPVSFIPNSMPAAIAWLCVFNQEKNHSKQNLFFKYVDYMYEHQPSESDDWVTDENLLKFAREASSDIHLPELRKCLHKRSYRQQIEKNTDYGLQLMKGDLSTPAVYVNGFFAEDITFSSLSKLINEALQPKKTR